MSRTCPALEKARSERYATRLDDAKTDRVKVRERELAHWTVAGLDVRDVARKCWAALGGCRAHWIGSTYGLAVANVPMIRLRRSAAKPHSTGRAWGARVTLTFGLRVDTAEVWWLVLHELAHCAVGCWHHHDEGYAPSKQLERALRNKLPAPARPAPYFLP